MRLCCQNVVMRGRRGRSVLCYRKWWMVPRFGVVKKRRKSISRIWSFRSNKKNKANKAVKWKWWIERYLQLNCKVQTPMYVLLVICFGRGWIQTGTNTKKSRKLSNVRTTPWEETKSLGSFVLGYGWVGLFTVNREAHMQGRRAFRGKDCFESGADVWKVLIRKPENLIVLISTKISKSLTRAVRWIRKMLYYL